MLAAVEGYVKNGKIVINENLAPYEGQNLIITFLNSEKSEAVPARKKINLDKYTRRTEWGQHVEEYMEEIRGNDRF